MACCDLSTDLVLDSRLALFHRRAQWLAVADVHYGFELSQRALGWLLPIWGMQQVHDRLRELILEYRPKYLVVVGDIVHSNVAQREASRFLDLLRGLGPELILIRGNHDRRIQAFSLRDHWREGAYFFHHGHDGQPVPADCVAVIGHHHPAWTYADATGTRLRVPALLETANRLILPAFSPWAAGSRSPEEVNGRYWICTRHRVFCEPMRSPTAAFPAASD